MNPPVAGDQDESIASALMGLHLDPMQSTSGTGNNVYIASGDARQIAGPVSTTFTGPIEKVEAFFTGSADEDRRRQDWLRILRWLAPVNQSKVHNTAKRDRQPKTGIWFIDGPEFNQWLVNPASLIWLHGSVGCGKTVLCSSIIEKIRDVCKVNKTSGLCYFYCSFKDGSQEDHFETLLRLFIYQLCRPDLVPTPLQGLYNECHEYPPSEPTNEELCTTLTDILKESHAESAETSDFTEGNSVRDPLKDAGLRNIYLIIDALDEIPLLQRWEVLEFLQKLATLRLPQLHMLVTSRNEPCIETALTRPTKWHAVLIDKSAVESDMRLYVASVLMSHPPLRHQPDSVKDSILLRLVDQGNGMFRWAALQVAMLKRLKVVNPGIIRQVLNKLPKDLDETYIRILTEIDRELYHQAVNAVKWLVCSIRPMFVEELAEACSIRPDKTPVLDDESERLEPHNVIEMLHDLVSVEPPIAQDAVILERTHSVRLAHFSVQEFLAGSDIGNSPAAAFRVNIGEAHYFVARCCLAYLYYYNTYSSRGQSFPLRVYAWYNWEKHILPDVLTSNDLVRRKAIRLYNILAKPDSHPRWEAHLAERCRESDEMRRVIGWLPLNGEQRLLDALNIPYFHADFDRFMRDHLPAKAASRRPSWPRSYEYSPLGIARKEVRLLTILPSLDENTEIRCQLRHVSLDDYPSYETLSYAWDRFSVTKPQTVFLEGVPIEVTPNLASILRSYRSHQENKLPVPWVDLISIDQQNEEERHHKVDLMGRIFEQAQDVVVSLGEEEEHDELAIEHLTTLASISLSVPDSDGQRDTEARFRDMFRIIVRKGEWPYILGLFKREWWRRCWSIQEIVLAAKATLLFGTLPLSFSIVEQVMRSESIIDQVLCKNVHPVALRRDPGWQAALHIAETRRERRSGIPITLPKLLYRFSGFRSADPRDQVYSLLGLVSHEVQFIPDDDSSVITVYKDVAMSILYTYQNLDVLSFCSKYSTTIKGLPMWVPCLCTPSQIAVIAPGVFAGRNNTDLFTAGEAGTVPIIESASESLKLLGWVFDEVAKMGDTQLSTLGETQPLEMMDAYAFTRHDSSLMTAQYTTLHLPSGQSRTEAYWRTLLADQWREGKRLGREIHGQSVIPPTTEQEAKALLQEPDLGIYLRFLPGRRFFLTSRGYLGLGLENTQPGDVIAVMPGGAVPYVLRADAQRSQNTEYGVYRFIGECYVHGIMDGEVPAERARESREPQYQVFNLI